MEHNWQQLVEEELRNLVPHPPPLQQQQQQQHQPVPAGYRFVVPPADPVMVPFNSRARQRRYQFRLARKSYGGHGGLGGRGGGHHRQHHNHQVQVAEVAAAAAAAILDDPIPGPSPMIGMEATYYTGGGNCRENFKEWRVRSCHRSYDVLVRADVRYGIQSDDGPEIENASGERSLYELVFSNHLVWKILGSYLNLSDLKDCRLVSRDFNRQVLDSTNFKDRALVKLTPELLKREQFGSTVETWKHVSVTVHRVCEKSECVKSYLHDLTWFVDMLSEVESLTLLKGPPCPVNIAGVSPSQSAIIKRCKKLKKLIVDEELLYHAVFKKCSAELAALKEFKIATQTDMSCNTALYGIEKMLGVSKQISIFRSSTELDINAHPHSVESNLQILSEFVKQNVGNLKCLKLRDPWIWSNYQPDQIEHYEPISKYVFPMLTSVRICVTWRNVDDVILFLKRQPHLTAVTIDSFDAGLQSFPNHLLLALSEISTRLKKLDIKAREFREIYPQDWNFLKHTTLEEFSLWPWRSRLYADPPLRNGNFVPELPRYLPATVTTVRLQGGANSLCPSNSNRNLHIPPIDLGRINPNLITKLNLSRLAGFITDGTVEYICRNFHLLQELHLSHLDARVTDYGFTGISVQHPKSQFSLKNLKGLRNLTIRRSCAITNYTLTEAIKLPELRFLDLSYNTQITVQGCIHVLKQNPSLEVFVNDHVTEFPMDEGVRRENFPRLKCLQKWLLDRD